MTHAVDRRTANLVGAFAVAVADRIAEEVELMDGPTGSAAAAVLLVHHAHVHRLDDLRVPLALSQAAVVRLVDRLEARGILRRAGRHDDRREVRLELTPAGDGWVAGLLAARERAVTGVLAGLPREQLAQLGRACERALRGAAAGADAPGRLCRFCDERACDLTRCPVELAAAGAGGAS